MKFIGFVIFVVLAQFVYISHCRCGKIFENSVSAAERKQIVDLHNHYRSLISKGKVPGQPQGTNLKTMKYDDKLAKAAQKISNTCEFAHKRVSDGRFYVGQNLYTYMSSAKAGGADWPAAIKAWFDEYKLYTYPNTPNSGTGHYTQLVWADTEYVGCGYSFYEENGFFLYKKLYTCNYGPGGNIIGYPPYKTS